MTEQSTLLTLLMVRLDTDRPVVEQLLMWTAFLRIQTPKYPNLHISVNDISA